MNEKKGVEWEGALSPYSALLQTTRQSKGVVNCGGTKRAGKLWQVMACDTGGSFFL
jgi:hypothetical protein